MSILFEISLSLLYSALFIFLIYRLKFFEAGGLSKRLISLIFILKILFGVFLWAIYTFYYTDRPTADIYKYFDDSKVMFDALLSKPPDYFKMLVGIANDHPRFDLYYSKMNHWYREFDSNLYNDSHTIIRVNALFRLFSFGYFNVHTVFINFFSITGLVALYKVFLPYFQDKSKGLIFSIFFIPSVLFWGSGVLKEGLIFFSLGLLVYFSEQLMNRRYYILSISGILFSVFLLIQTKFYILICILPALTAFVWAKKNHKRIVIKYLITLSVFALTGLNIQRIFPGYDAMEILTAKQTDFINLANGGVVLENDSIYIKIENNNRNALIPVNKETYKLKPGSSYAYWKKEDMKNELRNMNPADTSSFKLLWNMQEVNSKIEINKLEPTFISFIRHAPKAFFNTMFRPFITESGSLLIFFSAMENLFFLLVTVFAFLYRKKAENIDLNLVLFCLCFAVLLYILIGITTPVLGAIARYKVPALPFLLIALLEITDTEKLKKKFPAIQKYSI